MAFKITQTPTWRTEVTVEVMNDKGNWEKNKFIAVFERVPLADLEVLRQQSNPEALSRVLKGWEQVVDDEGAPVPFTQANVEAMLTITPAVSALTLAFWEGQIRARAKN